MSVTQNNKLSQITPTTLIVGADIAKKAHVARACDDRGVEFGKPLSFDNSRAGFERLLTWIHTLQIDHGKGNVVLGVEPTGHYWMNLAQFLRKRNVQVVLVNPLHVKRSKELDDNNPTKNDIKDARVIAQLVKDGRYSVPHIPEDVYAELRVGMNQRERLQQDLGRIQGRIHNWLDRFFPEFTDVFKDWEGKAALICLREIPCPQDVLGMTVDQIVHMWRKGGVARAVGEKRARLLLEKAKESIGLTQGLQMARKELQILLTQYDVLQTQIEQVMECVKEVVEQINGAKAMLTIPGVGLVTVAGFLAEVGDLSSYDHPNQIQKLAGLNLKENSSGKHKGKSQITKRGRPRLRGLLYRCVLTMVAKNPQFKAIHAYNTHRVNNPLKPKQSLVALCVKLIRVLFTLGTKRVPYDPGKLLGPVRQALLTQAA